MVPKFEVTLTLRTIFLFVLCSFLIQNALAQGVNTDFGQNRVQYRDFKWQKLTFDNLDIVYYDQENELAKNALETAVIELNRIENFLSYKYGGAMQIVIFHNLSDYRQSNIGYENPQYSAGGFLVIPKDVSTVYFNGDYHNLQIQLRKSICDIILKEMIYGGTLQDRFSNVRSPQLPDWFTLGLSSFLAESWSASDENTLMNAMATHRFSNFNFLEPELNVLAGKSIWRYLVEKYGAESLGTVMFIARYTHSAEAAIYFHTQKKLGEFLQDWKSFYQNYYSQSASAMLPRGVANIPQKIAKRTHTDIAISPDGKTIAIVTNDQGHYSIWNFHLLTGQVDLVYKGGQRVLNQTPDLGFPKIQWNPANGHLVFLTYESGIYQLRETTTNGHKLIYSFTNFSEISNFSINMIGTQILFSASKNGFPDLYQMNMDGSNLRALTNDIYTDKEAIFHIDNSVVFASNRPLNPDSSALFSSGVFNLFRITDGRMESITSYNEKTNISALISYESGQIGFISDISGSNNAWVCTMDSTKTALGQTNYQLGVLDQSISADHSILAELLLIQGQYHIFTSSVPKNPLLESVTPKIQSWKSTIENLDSLFQERNIHVATDLFSNSDTIQYSVIDSAGGNYKYQTGFPKVDYSLSLKADSSIFNNNFKKLRFINSLQPDYLLSQSENRNIGSYMHNNLIRKEALRNPVIMPYLKISLSDILKNYIIEAGFRSSLDLMINDYTARFAVLKYRTDHDLSIGRHSRKFEDGNNVLKQNLSTQVTYSLSYPFNEKNRITFSPGFRNELFTTKGTETNNLNTPDVKITYISSQFDYVYDNTRSLGLNMLSGLRLKTGFDYLKGTALQPAIFNYRWDARMYIPIWKKIIWANRISGVYALGKGKVAYYMGAVENWTAKTQFQNQTTNLPTTDNYFFQQWVSELRGFYRGVRMGSSFALLNSELRVPVVQLLVRRPINSEFFKNFTFSGFTDLGTAFIGKSPANADNPFNTVYINSPNYDISITSQRNPMALGLGYGIRSRFLGYFIKFDRAWGYLENKWSKPISYFSLGFDF